MEIKHKDEDPRTSHNRSLTGNGRYSQSQPSQWDSISKGKNYGEDNTRKIPQMLEGQPSKLILTPSKKYEQHNKRIVLQELKGTTVHSKLKTGRMGATRKLITKAPPTTTTDDGLRNLPECQHCREPPRSNVSMCKPKECVPIEAIIRIVNECSVAELSCPEGASCIGIEDNNGEIREHDLEEVELAICVNGAWQAETVSGKQPVNNIACYT
ncbi:unnamed protein product [Strongylus vulgaris]|uniref:Uncharacterized protein n=1 Tax=Strongylus vulgaris TaxID=40348 RepID=A0A3P7JYV0_STRVU|nr:unnamed protein product [Strongylus vulgaris]